MFLILENPIPMKRLIILLLLTFLIHQPSFGQEVDTVTVSQKEYRNTFKWNMTPQLLWGGTNLVFGIERTLSSHRSFSVNMGHLSFPKILNEESKLIQFVGTDKNTGFSFAFDYRFYAKKRNKNSAPDGLYWAPFFTSYNYKVQNSIDLLDNSNTLIASSTLDTKINAFNMGIELGYQFVFKERFTFDLILIGPAMGFYKAQLDLDTSLQSDNEYLDAIKDALANRFPMLGDLFENESVESNGNLSAFKPGFRYVLQVGFRL